MNRTLINRVAIIAFFVLLVYALYALPFAAWLSVVVEWMQQHAVAGPAVYVVGVVVATVLFVPGSGSMMIAGFLFGVLAGSVWAAIGITVGAQCSFLVGRRVARQWVEHRVAGNPRLRAIENGLREEAFVIVMLTRLSLIIPFNVLNYAYGITSVRSGVHLLATAVGMLPAVVLYVYLGTLARDLGQILSGEATPSELGYWVAAAGIAAIVVLTWSIHRLASRALERHLEPLDSTHAK